MFCVVVLGIAQAGDLKKVGRVGVKAMLYFEVVTGFALLIGVLLAYALQPGRRHEHRPEHAGRLARCRPMPTHVSDVKHGTVDFLMKIIPTTVTDAFAKGDILQVLLFAILFGAGLVLPGGARPHRDALHRADRRTSCSRSSVFIVRLAPLGVLGAIAFTVGKYGVGSLEPARYAGADLLRVLPSSSCCVVLGLIMRMAGFSIFKFLRYLREELMIVLGTASSDAVLPQIMRKLEGMGVRTPPSVWSSRRATRSISMASRSI